MPEAHRHSLYERRPRGRFGDTPGVLGAYATRIMLALVASLSLLLLLVHLPFYNLPLYVDWRQGFRSEPYTMPPEVGLELLAKAASEAPITAFEEVKDIEEEGDGEDELTSEALPTLAEPERPPIDRSAQKAPVLEFSEQMPKIVGGLGAYYIHIEYPAAARQAGIQGRLVLDFVVEPDGRTSDIRVLQSLHPLCDSAAVRALRQTYFMPGVQDGEKVRVRMRLPVRFRLIDRNALPVQEQEEPAANAQS